MHRKYTLGTFILSAILSSGFVLSEQSEVLFDEIPPGCVELGFNRYIDIGEITNLDWLEYSYWISEVHGEQSKEYFSSLPDTLIWEKSLAYGDPLVSSYFRHPAYHAYPVVGISKAQAEKYSKWRSDRVYESMLVEAGVIEYLKADKENYFSIEKYLKGEIPKLKESDIPIPVYRLPTKFEWESAAKGRLDANLFPYGINTSEKRIQKALRKGHFLNNIKRSGIPMEESGIINDEATITAPAISYLPNNIGCYNMIGNVSEMVEEEDICKGGSWKDLEKDVGIYVDFTYEGPEAWLGFRNVCSYQTKEKYKNALDTKKASLY